VVSLNLFVSILDHPENPKQLEGFLDSKIKKKEFIKLL